MPETNPVLNRLGDPAAPRVEDPNPPPAIASSNLAVLPWLPAPPVMPSMPVAVIFAAAISPSRQVGDSRRGTPESTPPRARDENASATNTSRHGGGKSRKNRWHRREQMRQ
jgi:hypothetical protein